MIFESKKSYESAGQAQTFAQLWDAVRTKVECSRMFNDSGADIERSRVLDLENGGAPRAVLLAKPASDEQFGVTEQAIADGARGIVRRQNIVRVKMEDGMTPDPHVGDKVVVSDLEDGAGTVRAVPGSPRVGTIADITGYNTLISPANPYVFVLLRRCTRLPVVP